MSDRIPLDDLTSDQLDDLYDQLDESRLKALNLQRDLDTQRWYAEDRLRTGRLQRQRAETAEARVTELDAERVHLVAGQCIDRAAICEQHHVQPVDGCPYPRCKAARERKADHA